MTLRRALFALSLTIILLTAGLTAAAEGNAGQYAEALRAHLAGDTERALAELERLAGESPADVPVHRAIALLAIDAGEDTTKDWNNRFWRRLRRTRRDVGASVGRAILLAHGGRRREAHSLLTSALTSGARHPLLAPHLVETSSDPAGLGRFLAARARVLGRDAPFAALRVRVLYEIGDIAAAGSLLEDAIERYPEHPDLLALHAMWLRAAGRERHAGEQASHALGLLGLEETVPELRIARRLGIARALAAAGLVDDADKVLRTLGPILALGPERQALREGRRVVAAEIALANNEPLVCLGILREHPPAGPAWNEAAEAVAVRARAALGYPSAPEVPPGALPKGLALADRATRLTVEFTEDEAKNRELSRHLGELAAELRRQALTPRSERVAIAGAFLAGDLDALRALVPEPSGEDSDERRPSPELRAAAALAIAQSARSRGDDAAALTAAQLSPLAISGAPGRLLAALRLCAARAALSLGRFEEAKSLVHEGLLDIQEADMVAASTPPELEGLLRRVGDPATRLPGVAFAASLAEDEPLATAGGTLLRNLGRAARTWSILATSWPGDLDAVARALPEASCLVVASPLEEAPALVLSPRHAATAPPLAEALSSPGCANARVVYWTGPAAPTGGLSAAEGDPRLLVRVVGPEAPLDTPPALEDAARPWPVGAGEPRALRVVAEEVADAESLRLHALPDVAGPGELQWPIFGGAGVASSDAPLASGWLLGGRRGTESGWLGVESIASVLEEAGLPLVALGVATRPGGLEAEKGAWVISEAAMSAGAPWALISRVPLEDEEYGVVFERIDDFADNPLDAAGALAAKRPEIARKLTLWSAPGRLPAQREWPLLELTIAASALVLLGALWRMRLLSRRR